MRASVVACVATRRCGVTFVLKIVRGASASEVKSGSDLRPMRGLGGPGEALQQARQRARLLEQRRRAARRRRRTGPRSTAAACGALRGPDRRRAARLRVLGEIQQPDAGHAVGERVVQLAVHARSGRRAGPRSGGSPRAAGPCPSGSSAGARPARRARARRPDTAAPSGAGGSRDPPSRRPRTPAAAGPAPGRAAGKLNGAAVTGKLRRYSYSWRGKSRGASGGGTNVCSPATCIGVWRVSISTKLRSSRFSGLNSDMFFSPLGATIGEPRMRGQTGCGFAARA